MKTENSGKDFIASVVKGINKEFGMGSVATFNSLDLLSSIKTWVPTGSTLLDRAIGHGGIPAGRIIEIVGQTSTGKSALGAHILANTQKQGGVAVLLDCVSGDTEVVCPITGEISTVRQLYESPHERGRRFVLGCVDNKMKVCEISNVVKKGKRKLLEFTTPHHMNIKVSRNHAMLTHTGWKLAKDIRVGDYLACPRRISWNTPRFAPISLKDSELKLLGYWISEGGRKSTTITNTAASIITDLGSCVKDLGLELREEKTKTPQGAGRGSFTVVDRQYHKRNRFKDLLVRLGLWETYSRERFVPGGIFSTSNKKLGVFLGTLFAGDGGVYTGKNKNSTEGDGHVVDYHTSSKVLAEQIKFLLLRLGITSRIDNPKNYGTGWSRKEVSETAYEIVVCGRDNLEKLSEKVKLVGKQRKSLEIKLRKPPKKRCFPLSDRVPGRRNCECTTKEIQDYLSLPIYFLPVTSVEDVGKEEVFDLTVPEAGNFVANGFVVHNTEWAWDRPFASRLGVDDRQLITCQPDHLTQAFEIIVALVTIAKEEAPGRLVTFLFDTFSACPTREELEGDFGDSTVGLHARRASQALRKLSRMIAEEQIALVFVSQLKQKITSMPFFGGEQETSIGGRAIGFHASVRIQMVRVGKVYDKKKRVIGIKCLAKVTKNKVAPPFREARFEILFNAGIDEVGSLLDPMIEEEIIKKKGGWCFYGEKEKFQRGDFPEFYKAHPELKKKLKEAWDK